MLHFDTRFLLVIPGDPVNSGVHPLQLDEPNEVPQIIISGRRRGCRGRRCRRRGCRPTGAHMGQGSLLW